MTLIGLLASRSVWEWVLLIVPLAYSVKTVVVHFFIWLDGDSSLTTHLGVLTIDLIVCWSLWWAYGAIT